MSEIHDATPSDGMDASDVERVQQAARRGRPRQPNCPDCLKLGRVVPKQSGNGYCREHQSLRVRSYRRSYVEDVTPERARDKILSEENERLRGEVAHLREVNTQLDQTVTSLLSESKRRGDANPHGLSRRGQDAQGGQSEHDLYEPPAEMLMEEQGARRPAELEAEAWKQTFFTLRDWALPSMLALAETGDLPMIIKAYIDMEP